MSEDIAVTGSIGSVAKALQIAGRFSNQDRWKWPANMLMPKYQPPFGIWYRGQCTQHPLVPSVFRKYDEGKRSRWINETNLFFHFMLRSPSYRETIALRSSGCASCNTTEPLHGCWIGLRASS
jgi:hypothetical protein